MDRLEAERLDQRVHRSVAGRQELQEQPHHHHGGDEVGRIGDHLRGLLEARRLRVVDQQRQDDRDGKPRHQGVDGDADGVAHHARELVGAEELDELIEPHPRAAPDPLDGDELAERDLGAVHRQVVEDHEVGDGYGEDQVELPVAADPRQEPPAAPADRLRGCRVHVRHTAYSTNHARPRPTGSAGRELEDVPHRLPRLRRGAAPGPGAATFRHRAARTVADCLPYAGYRDYDRRMYSHKETCSHKEGRMIDISRTVAVGALVAALTFGAAGAAFAAGEAEAGASGVAMSAPGVLPIVEETVTLRVAAIPHATVEDLTTNYATEWLEQQTGVHVEWNVLPRKDARQKINLMLTSATDLPDVFLGNGAVTPEQATLYGGQGLFLPLNDFIDQYSTEVKRFFEENPLIEKIGTSPDGNIYSLGNYDLCYHCYYSQRVWYNKTWLDKLGLAVPQTTEELYAVLTAFKTQDPNGNGKADEVPFTGATTGWNTTLDGYLMNPFEYNDARDRLYLDGGNGGGRVHYRRLARRAALHEQAVRRGADRSGGVHPGSEPDEAGCRG